VWGMVKNAISAPAVKARTKRLRSKDIYSNLQGGFGATY
jgi:hypothetical protein